MGFLPLGPRLHLPIIHANDGTSYLDRTTLTPLAGDRVRQVMEVSHDGGKTWQTTFDAEYRRPK